MSKTLFVTGSTGFIGRHLVRALVRHGHRVVAFLGPGADLTALDGTAVETFDHQGDIETLLDHFQTHAYDGVVHLATCYVAEHTPQDIDRLVDANLRFGLQVLEATTRTKVPWLINVGTIWQHFNRELYNPANLYAATKQAFEDLLRYYHETTETILTTVKFCDTYGPEDTRRKVFALWQDIARTGERLAMSPGEQLVDIVHVADVVAALERLIERLATPDTARGLAGKTFAVSSGQPRPLRELAALFERVVGRRLPIDWGARPYRQREVMVPWQGEPVPGWRPTISLEDGIRELYR